MKLIVFVTAINEKIDDEKNKHTIAPIDWAFCL
jgi:hypothetical protein